MTNIYQSLVDHFGTQKALADALEAAQPTVSGWVRGAFGMSPEMAIRAEKATSGKFSRRDLCPNFPWVDA